MGTTRDMPSDDIGEALSKQMDVFKTQAQQQEEEQRKRQIRLLRARSSNLLDTFNSTSTTLGG